MKRGFLTQFQLTTFIGGKTMIDQLCVEAQKKQEPKLTIGETSFEGVTFSSGNLAPCNGLLSYRITAFTTSDGKVHDASKLNSALYNHYQMVLGQNMMGVGSPVRGKAILVEKKGKYELEQMKTELLHRYP